MCSSWGPKTRTSLIDSAFRKMNSFQISILKIPLVIFHSNLVVPYFIRQQGDTGPHPTQKKLNSSYSIILKSRLKNDQKNLFSCNFRFVCEPLGGQSVGPPLIGFSCRKRIPFWISILATPHTPYFTQIQTPKGCSGPPSQYYDWTRHTRLN